MHVPRHRVNRPHCADDHDSVKVVEIVSMVFTAASKAKDGKNRKGALGETSVSETFQTI